MTPVLGANSFSAKDTLQKPIQIPFKFGWPVRAAAFCLDVERFISLLDLLRAFNAQQVLVGSTNPYMLGNAQPTDCSASL